MRFLNVREVFLRQAELPDADLDVVLVEQPHDARLAVVGRQHADAEVELLVAGGDLDAAVLAAAALGDVHLGENLDAAQQGAEQTPRRAVAFDQHAVDAVADADAVFERLDVNVRSPQLDRFGDHQLDEPDDRGAGFIDDVVGVARGVVFGFGEVDRRVGEFLQHRVGRFAVDLAVVAVDRFEDAFLGRDADLDLAVENELQLVEGFEVVADR